MKKQLAALFSSLFSSLGEIVDGLVSDPAISSLMPREMFSETSHLELSSLEIDSFPQPPDCDD